MCCSRSVRAKPATQSKFQAFPDRLANQSLYGYTTKSAAWMMGGMQVFDSLPSDVCIDLRGR